MKTTLFSLISLFVLSLAAHAQTQGKLTVTMDYNRLDERATNQYAVWVENAQGKLVKTLFVTRFSGKGGYRTRPVVPTWVSKADTLNLTAAKADAFTGATPATGRQTYIWDGKDDAGKALSNGTYNFYVEAILSFTHRVVYKGTVTLGGQNQASIPITPAYFPDENVPTKNLIGSIRAGYTR